MEPVERGREEFHKVIPHAIEYDLEDIMEFVFKFIPPIESWAVVDSNGKDIEGSVVIRIVPENLNVEELINLIRESFNGIADSIINESKGPLVLVHCVRPQCLWTDIYKVEDRGEPETDDLVPCPNCESSTHFHRFEDTRQMEEFIRMDSAHGN